MELTAATGYGLTDVAQVSKASDPVTVHDARVGSNFAVDFVTTNGKFFLSFRKRIRFWKSIRQQNVFVK